MHLGFKAPRISLEQRGADDWPAEREARHGGCRVGLVCEVFVPGSAAFGGVVVEALLCFMGAEMEVSGEVASLGEI
jgi:hypothetical protein